jgi:hypothetical protein
MDNFFIIETQDKVGFYGQTDYCIVRAETKHEAVNKVKKRYSGIREEILNRNVVYPNCKVKFDEDGVSGIVRHVW